MGGTHWVRPWSTREFIKGKVMFYKMKNKKKLCMGILYMKCSKFCWNILLSTNLLFLKSEPK